MDIPDDLKRELARRLEEDGKDAKRAREAKQDHQEELKRIAEFRRKNKKELMVLAKFAAKWISDFYKSQEGKKIIKATYGALIVFSSCE